MLISTPKDWRQAGIWIVGNGYMSVSLDIVVAAWFLEMAIQYLQLLGYSLVSNLYVPSNLSTYRDQKLTKKCGNHLPGASYLPSGSETT